MRIHSKLPQVGTTIFTVMSRLAEQYGALNLGQGFPDFEPPAALLEALARCAAQGRNQYAPMAGIPALREQIASKLRRDYGRALDPESEITITSGATEAIFDVVAALVGADDEVILLDPSYDSYGPAVALQGARARHVPLDAEHFSIDFERLRAALTPRTRLLVINFPHNPSGAVLGAEDLDRLAGLLRDTSCWLLSDEVYEHIVFDGGAHQSVLRHPELAERSLQVGSFGKAYHATGWKVGWIAAPRALTEEVRKVHQFVTFSTNTPAQHALAEVLVSAPEHLHELSGFYQRKRDLFRSLLSSSRLQFPSTRGTYFQLADYSALSRLPDQAFAERLVREAGVAAIPISGLYQAGSSRQIVRFCFAKGNDTLERACERLLRFEEKLLNE
ncbi:MAG TPA: methionine aminotransferase [Polyangiaceae bacterium]|nr:methionine aminotransferase [Polyangiaceae bacterium]